MTKIMNDASYEVAEMPGQGRLWFKRGYCDVRYGKIRQVLITLEKADYEDVSVSGLLPWNVRIDDRSSRQFWKLMVLNIDGEEKLMFERTVRGRNGGKGDNLNLGYTPDWLIEELKQVAIEMKERKLNEEGMKYVDGLVEKIVEAKKENREKFTAQVEETEIGGLFHIMSQTRGDDRGSFREVVRFPEIEVMTGYDFVGKQVNHSFSRYGTLRGLHVEPWAKLVTVTSGLAICTFLDCRPQSISFGKMHTEYLGFGTTKDGKEIKGGAMFIEPGIANSVLTLSDKLDYTYVVDDLWTPATATFAVNPMDNDLAIPWTDYVPEKDIIRSERDMTSPTFEEFIKSVS
jgi:dTDP-4-dehydrorhamnose 3,5-epimerase-like enzyme